MSRLSFLIFLNAALWFLAGTLYHTKSKGINEISSRVDDITLRCKTRLGGGGRVSVSGRKAPGTKQVVNGFTVPTSPCQLSQKSIQNALSQQKDCSKGGHQIFVNDTWMTSEELKVYLRPPKILLDHIQCVLYCIEKTAPCVGDHPCLIPLYLRHNSSDAESVISVFEKGELDILKPSWNMEVILDAGGGIGASAVFLSTMFPEATILSMEPDPKKFEVLLLNSYSFPNIFPIRAALHSNIQRMTFHKSAHSAKKIQSKKGHEEGVQAVPVRFLQNIFVLPEVEFLKLNIEEEQSSLLRKKLDWLKTAKFAMVSFLHKEAREDELSLAFKKIDGWKYLGWWGKYKIFKSNTLEIS